MWVDLWIFFFIVKCPSSPRCPPLLRMLSLLQGHEDILYLLLCLLKVLYLSLGRDAIAFVRISNGSENSEWPDSIFILFLQKTAAAKSLQSCLTLATHQAPLSLGSSRQEYWRGLPFPPPMHESEKWKVKAKSFQRAGSTKFRGVVGV